MSNTMLALEVEDELAVIWTRPDDYEVPAEITEEGLRSLPDGLLILMADGSVRMMNLPEALEVLPALFSRAGGETFDTWRRDR